MKSLIYFLTCIIIGQSIFAVEYCITIGDSQSSGPLKYNYGFTPELHKVLNSNGFDVYSYAMPGSGSVHWQDIRKRNVNYFFRDQQSTPYQKASIISGAKRLDDLILKRSTDNPNYISQIINYHSDKNTSHFNCFIMQIGDNDNISRAGTSNENSMNNSIESAVRIISQIKSMSHSPDLCGIVTPTHKENHRNDQYPSITTNRKKIYVRKLVKSLTENGLLKYCPVLDTLTPSIKNKYLEHGSFTSDGLHINDKAGRIWAREALKLHHLLK